MKLFDVLTVEQDKRANDWMLKHIDHVEKLKNYESKIFPPSLQEDKNDPRLWKPGHWKWYSIAKYESLKLM